MTNFLKALLLAVIVVGCVQCVRDCSDSCPRACTGIEKSDPVCGKPATHTKLPNIKFDNLCRMIEKNCEPDELIKYCAVPLECCDKKYVDSPCP